MEKVIFLDRDGTINVEKHYLYKKDDFEFLPRVFDGLKLLQNMKFKLIIITNQSGIARGYYTEDDYRQLSDWMLAQLTLQGIIIDALYYCPHHPEAKILKYRIDCDCRKPKLGLYELASKDFDVDFSKSFAIGDKIRDCVICEVTACRGFLIGNNEETEVIEQVQKGMKHNVEYAIDLYAAAKKIVTMI